MIPLGIASVGQNLRAAFEVHHCRDLAAFLPCRSTFPFQLQRIRRSFCWIRKSALYTRHFGLEKFRLVSIALRYARLQYYSILNDLADCSFVVCSMSIVVMRKERMYWSALPYPRPRAVPKSGLSSRTRRNLLNFERSRATRLMVIAKLSTITVLNLLACIVSFFLGRKLRESD